ncbi:MAG TPA: type 4a pilus biogenesis protein PilO [Gemmatimonadales bacterium]|jgi:type IV pilus assembly protein PilO|nr:type 4a pilus biogenesis protein PilO [Gemmatimonadales bacterium]
MAFLGMQNPAPAFAVILAGAAAYIGYDGLSIVGLHGIREGKERAKAVQDSITTLTAETDSARAQLAQGTMEDLRRRLNNYRISLELMRRLVPERNEVPNLLDAITTRARIRGVNLSQVSPMPLISGPAPFDTQSYQLSVLGHYDQIGEFLADIASLERIIVPVDLKIAQAPAQSAKALGDSTGAMLEAKFLIRTYVKTSNPEAASGT